MNKLPAIAIVVSLCSPAWSQQVVERKFSELVDERAATSEIFVQVPDDEVLIFDGETSGKVIKLRGKSLYVVARRARTVGVLKIVGRDLENLATNPDLVPGRSPFDAPAAPGPGGSNGGRCETGGNGQPGNPGAGGAQGESGKPGALWVFDIEEIEGDGTVELLNSGGRGGKGQQGQTGGKGGKAGRGGDARAYVPGRTDDCGGFNAGQPGDGGPGGTGGLGGPGGAGGTVYLSASLIKESSRSQGVPRISISVAGGPGGEGGEGGIGGGGGEGNDGGSGEREKSGGSGSSAKAKAPDQPKAQSGPDGPAGAKLPVDDVPIALEASSIATLKQGNDVRSSRVVSTSQTGDTFSTSWLSARYAPCPGVGVAGSFRVFVEGTASAMPAGAIKRITSLAVHASSAAFTQLEGSIAARAIVKRGTGVASQVALQRAAPPAVEPAPKSDETRRLYLPRTASLSVGPSDRLTIEVSAVARSNSGTCALGTSTGDVPVR